MAILGIALGIATVLAVQVIDHNTILTETKRRGGGAGGETDSPWNLHLRPVHPGIPPGGSLPESLLAEPDLTAFQAVVFSRVDLRVGEGREATSLRLQGIGPSSEPEIDTSPAARQGRPLAQPSSRELLVSPRLAESLELSLGQKVELSATRVLRRGCVGGEIVDVETDSDEEVTIESFEIVGVLRSQPLSGGPDVVAPFDACASLLQGKPAQPVYLAQLTPSGAYQDVRERLKSSYLVERPRTALVGERIDQKAFRKAIRLTSLVALLLGSFVIYHSFSLAVVQRVRDIGLLRAIGLTRNQVLASILFEGTVLATLGALGGLVLSGILVVLLKTLRITTLGFGKPIYLFEIPWIPVILVTTGGALAALLGMVAPLLRARGLSVLDAIRQGKLQLQSSSRLGLRLFLSVALPLSLPLLFIFATPPLGQRQGRVLVFLSGIAGILGLFLFFLFVRPGPIHRLVEAILTPLSRLYPVESGLAQGAIRGSKLRILGSLFGLVTVLTAIFCVRAVHRSFLHEMDGFSNRAVSGRFFLKTRTVLDRDLLERSVAHLPGVLRWDLVGEEVYRPFPLRGLSPSAATTHFASLPETREAEEDFQAGKTLILSRFLASSFGYEVGDRVELPTFRGPVTVTVGSISDRVGYFPDDRSFALLNSERLADLYCIESDRGSRWTLGLEEGADRERIRSRIRDRLGAATIEWMVSDEELIRRYSLDRRRDFFIFDITLGMLALVACVGLLHSLFVSVLERRREIGLLRSLGLTRNRVARLLLLESAALGTVGGLLTTGLTLPLTALLIPAVRTISRLELEPSLGPADVFGPLIASLSLCLVATLWPALGARNLDLPSLARYE